MLRTNLLLTLGADNKVVTCTSTVLREGKTFIALNTAISLSLLNKRVLLVGLDLRIPRLREYMNLETRDGITSYLGLREGSGSLDRAFGHHGEPVRTALGGDSPQPGGAAVASLAGCCLRKAARGV